LTRNCVPASANGREGSVFSRLQHTSVSHAIAAQIYSALIGGTLKPGQQTTEEAIARSMGERRLGARGRKRQELCRELAIRQGQDRPHISNVRKIGLLGLYIDVIMNRWARGRSISSAPRWKRENGVSPGRGSMRRFVPRISFTRRRGHVPLPSGQGSAVMRHPTGARGRPASGLICQDGRLSSLPMESTELAGHPYGLNTNTLAHSGGNKKQRDLEMLGGGTGDGAVIWAPADGGNDALIGTPFGVVTGAAGVALTGNKDIAIRTELAITFRPLKPVEQQLTCYTSAHN
jgi:hypothetical protein